MILTSGDAGAALWAAADPCPDDKTLLAGAEELEGHVAELLKLCKAWRDECEAEFEDGAARLAAALSAAQSAQWRMEAAATPQLHAAAEADWQDAMDQAEALRATTADCEAGLEALTETRSLLDSALTALRQVPDDMQVHYETPYAFVRAQGPLPVDGDFLTGSAA
jgi:hypothetical protein